VKELMETYSK